MNRLHLRLLLGVVLLVPTAAPGQHVSASDSAKKTMFTARDAVTAGVITATSAVISIFDERIARWTQTPRVQGGSSRQDAADALTTINEVPLTIAAGATWAIGRLTGQRTVADIGLHTGEALVLTLTAAEIVRGTLGRMRPRVSPDDSYDFQYGKGFTEFDARAYPSIHSAVAFTVAAALSEEIRHRKPGAARIAAPLLYGAALVPGITRMYLNQHWTSDIVAGAALGALIGNRIVHYTHTHRPSRLDRALLRVAVLPDGRIGVVTSLWAMGDGRWAMGDEP